MVIGWLSWLPKKSDFINFNILETLKDSPNTPPSLKLLEQIVHELIGDPLTMLWGEDLDQEGLNHNKVAIGNFDELVQKGI